MSKKKKSIACRTSSHFTNARITQKLVEHQKEGKNEENHSIHDIIDDTGSLHSAADPDT
jgi:hypothetical protein